MNSINVEIIILTALVIFLGLLSCYLFYALRKERKKAGNDKKEELGLESMHDHMKSAFLSNISQEVRTPLMLIIGPLGQALEKVKNVDIKTHLTTAMDNAQKLLEVADRVLDTGSMDTSEIIISRSLENMNKTLKRIFQNFDSLATAKSISMHFESTLSDQAFGNIDVEKYEEILNNLIMNAIKFSSNEGEVRMHVGHNNQQIRIEIHDFGAGMPKHELERIFIRYYKSDKSSSEGGIGIGLSVAKELVDAMKGKLIAESEEGKGSVFTVLLPLNLEQKAVSDQEPKTTEDKGLLYKSDLLNKGRKKVLLVEDNEDMSEYLVTLLSSDFDCEIASNGMRALEMLRTKDYDVVSSDLMMPGMDGLELLSHIRSKDKSGNIPFIMLTGKNLKGDKLKAFTLGVDDYITKPFNPDEYIVRIKNLITNRVKRHAWSVEESNDAPELDKGEDLAAEKAFLKQAESKVMEHLDDANYNVTALAEDMSYSRRQLARIIKKITGLTPVEFIREIRLQQAYQMMADRSYFTISEIRFKVGIENASYFTKMFKERFGVNPREVMSSAI